MEWLIAFIICLCHARLHVGFPEMEPPRLDRSYHSDCVVARIALADLSTLIDGDLRDYHWLFGLCYGPSDVARGYILGGCKPRLVGGRDMLHSLGPRVAREFWDSRIATWKHSPITRDVALLYHGLRDQAASNDLAQDLALHAVVSVTDAKRVGMPK